MTQLTSGQHGHAGKAPPALKGSHTLCHDWSAVPRRPGPFKPAPQAPLVLSLDGGLHGGGARRAVGALHGPARRHRLAARSLRSLAGPGARQPVQQPSNAAPAAGQAPGGAMAAWRQQEACPAPGGRPSGAVQAGDDAAAAAARQRACNFDAAGRRGAGPGLRAAAVRKHQPAAARAAGCGSWPALD